MVYGKKNNLNLKQVYTSSAPLRRSPENDSLLETECLYGETLKPLSINKDWFFCQTKIDDYKGWIHSSFVGDAIKCTHRVSTLRTYVYYLPDEKSKIIQYLPMGAKVFIKSINTNWAKIFSPNTDDFTGYVPENHVTNLKYKVKDWVSSAEQLIGAPYKWGGRDSLGIDCSALIQIALETINIKIPRDTSKQIKSKKSMDINFKSIKRGSVVFWDGHVGVMIDKSLILHANAFHMKTIVEPLNDVIKRAIKKNSDIIKIANFI